MVVVGRGSGQIYIYIHFTPCSLLLPLLLLPSSSPLLVFALRLPFPSSSWSLLHRHRRCSGHRRSLSAAICTPALACFSALVIIYYFIHFGITVYTSLSPGPDLLFPPFLPLWNTVPTPTIPIPYCTVHFSSRFLVDHLGPPNRSVILTLAPGRSLLYLYTAQARTLGVPLCLCLYGVPVHYPYLSCVCVCVCACAWCAGHHSPCVPDFPPSIRISTLCVLDTQDGRGGGRGQLST